MNSIQQAKISSRKTTILHKTGRTPYYYIYVSKMPNKFGSFKRTSYLCSEKRKHNMAYAKIDIVIKKPSQKLEERIREVGRQKYERMQKTLHDWKEGKYKNAKVLLVK